jgi:cutinase
MQGVDYAAGLAQNFTPGGATSGDISKMEDLINQVATKCPQAKIVAGGYRYAPFTSLYH